MKSWNYGDPYSMRGIPLIPERPSVSCILSMCRKSSRSSFPHQLPSMKIWRCSVRSQRYCYPPAFLRLLQNPRKDLFWEVQTPNSDVLNALFEDMVCMNPGMRRYCFQNQRLLSEHFPWWHSILQSFPALLPGRHFRQHKVHNIPGILLPHSVCLFRNCRQL